MIQSKICLPISGKTPLPPPLFVYVPFVSSIPRRFIDSHPRTGGVQSGVLPCGLALLNELRQDGTGQKRESPAVRCLHILFVSEVIEIHLTVIITPDFRHTQS